MPTATDANERIGRLETAVEGLHSEFAEVRGTLKDIQTALSRTKETNWSVIFAGIAIVLALYAAAIRPISNDLERQRRDAETLAQAVIAKDVKVSDLTVAIAKQAMTLESLTGTVKTFQDMGTPVTDKRLSLIEFELKRMAGTPVAIGGK